jgi:hypothetical protein
MAAGVAAQTVTGSGSQNTVPLFTGSSTIGNSPISASGSNVGIGTTSPSSLLYLSGQPNPRLTIYNQQTGPVDEGVVFSSATVPSGSIIASWWGGGMTFTTPRDIVQSGFHFVAQSGTEAVHIDTSSGGMAIGSPYASPTQAAPINGLIVSGNIGIGTTTPSYNLDVNGKIHSSAGVVYQDATTQTTAWTGVLCGGDYAEAVVAAGEKKYYEPGDVLVVSSGDNDVEKSSEPYSTKVAGILATKPGVIGRRETLAKDANDLPMAMVGIVPTKVTTENGPVHKGDLLVTSSKAGYAMKGIDRTKMLGAVIGKAMDSLESGTGVIAVLVTLQ